MSDFEFLEHDGEYGFAMSSRWLMRNPILTIPEKAVLVIFKDFQKNGNKITPSIQYLIDELGSTKKIILHAIKGLESKGFISIDKNRGHTNNYRLNAEVMNNMFKESSLNIKNNSVPTSTKRELPTSTKREPNNTSINKTTLDKTNLYNTTNTSENLDKESKLVEQVLNSSGTEVSRTGSISVIPSDPVNTSTSVNTSVAKPQENTSGFNSSNTPKTAAAPSKDMNTDERFSDFENMLSTIYIEENYKTDEQCRESGETSAFGRVNKWVESQLKYNPDLTAEKETYRKSCITFGILLRVKEYKSIHNCTNVETLNRKLTDIVNNIRAEKQNTRDSRILSEGIVKYLEKNHNDIEPANLVKDLDFSKYSKDSEPVRMLKKLNNRDFNENLDILPNEVLYHSLKMGKIIAEKMADRPADETNFHICEKLSDICSNAITQIVDFIPNTVNYLTLDGYVYRIAA